MLIRRRRAAALAVASVALVGTLVGAGSVGCSGRSDTPTSIADPVDHTGSGGSITIYLEGGSAFPRLKTDVKFFAAIDPGPHVQPIAGAIVKVFAGCASQDLKAPAVILLSVRDKTMHANPKSPSALCLAKALDGQPIDDRDDVTVEITLSGKSAS